MPLGTFYLAPLTPGPDTNGNLYGSAHERVTHICHTRWTIDISPAHFDCDCHTISPVLAECR